MHCVSTLKNSDSITPFGVVDHIYFRDIRNLYIFKFRESGNEFIAIFKYKKLMGMKLLLQPPMLNWPIISFNLNSNLSQRKRNNFERKAIDVFIEYVRENFHFFNFIVSLNHHPEIIELQLNRCNISIMPNYHLDSSECSASNYDKKLRHALKNNKIRIIETFEDNSIIFDVLNASLARNGQRLISKNMFQNLIDNPNIKFLYGLDSSRLVAVSVLYNSGNALHYLAAGATEHGRSLAASTALLDAAINLSSHCSLDFHFMGSRSEAIASNFRKFGAAPSYNLLITNIPKSILKLRKYARSI